MTVEQLPAETAPRQTAKKKRVGGPELAFSYAQMAQAFNEARGQPRIVARLLQCSPTTVYSYMKRWPRLKEYREDRKTLLGEELQEAAYNIARNPDHPRCVDMIRFLLAGQFKHLGHLQKLNIAANPGLVEEVDQAIRDLGIDPNVAFRNMLDQARAEKRRQVLDGVDQAPL